jgi:nitric oxide reductase subunit C
LLKINLLRICTAVLFSWLAACSSSALSAAPTRTPQEIRGQQVFESYCSSCHSTVGESIVVGPSLAGIASRGGSRMADMDAEAYIRSSILSPESFTVEGFPTGTMPQSLEDDLSEEDLEAVVAYLLTLK